MSTTYAPVLSTPVDTTHLSGAVRFHLTMAAISAGCFVLDYAVWPAQTIGPLSAAPYTVYLAAATAYAGWAGHRRVFSLLSTVLWLALFLLSTGPLLAIAGSSHFGLVDQVLARHDIVSTGAIVRWVQAHRSVWWISAASYWSMMPLLGAALLLPGLCRQYAAARRFLLAAAIAGLITTAIFAVMPAAGPWTVESYKPTAAQMQTTRQLAALKAHQVVGRLETGAIVSFPSFHTVLALLSAAALWPLRKLRWIAATLAIAICISTVTTGWHYGVDVLGGILVAYIAWKAARLSRSLASRSASAFPQ